MQIVCTCAQVVCRLCVVVCTCAQVVCRLCVGVCTCAQVVCRLCVGGLHGVCRIHFDVL